MVLAMNNHFFALFDLPIGFEIDQAKLKARFLALQKEHHPDRQQTAVNQNSALINHAYNTLSRDDHRAAYLLTLVKQDLDLDQSIDDWDFLDIMMQLRIDLDDTEDQNALNDLSSQVAQYASEQAQRFIIAYDAQNWQQAKDATRKLQFLGKLNDDIIAKISEQIAQNDHDDDLYV